MNIFYLDPDPIIAAQAQCDVHIVKMPLETAQMLSTAAHAVAADSTGGAAPAGVYRPAYARHPSTVWAGLSAGNAAWLVAHGRALAAEYARRFGREHASLRVIKLAGAYLDAAMAPGAMQPPPLAMPDEFKSADHVAAYREYYRWKAVTLTRFRYTRAVPPAWLGEAAA